MLLLVLTSALWTTSSVQADATVAPCKVGVVPLAAGASGFDVSCVQDTLGALGYPVAAEEAGVFGAATTQAVTDYQTVAQLPVTGFVDNDTATALGVWTPASGETVSAVVDETTTTEPSTTTTTTTATTTTTPPVTTTTTTTVAPASTAPAATTTTTVAPATTTPPAGCTVSATLRTGSTGQDVVCLQEAINRNRAAGIRVDGRFGPVTAGAVREFQGASGLPSTGVADSATLQRYGIWADPAPAPPPPSGGCTVSRTLRQGNSGPDVVCLQQAINRNRVSGIRVDGSFGPVTAGATGAFQGAVGLPVTGIADSATLQRYGIWNPTTPVAAPPPTTPQTSAAGAGLPANSGSGRRIVYSRAQQRIWAVDANGNVAKTHRVSGRMYEPYAGTYRVFSRSLHTYSADNPAVRWRYMVRFARGPGGGNIGFHEIPNRNGRPLQTKEQLGLPLSGGCVRQSSDDALWIWNWAGTGTVVVVL